MKKVVVKLDLHGHKQKQKALKTVSSLRGIDSISMDMKEKKMTVVGDVDPVDIVSKLRKFWYTEMLTVGPAKEENKDDKKGDKKDDDKMDQTCKQVDPYRPYNPYMTTHCYVVHVAEEYPSSCVIC